MTIPDEVLAELERLEEKATRAPWWISENDGSWCAGTGDDGRVAVSVGDADFSGSDEYFLLCLRNHARELLTTCRQVEELKAELDREREERAVRARALTSVLQEAEELRALARKALRWVPVDASSQSSALHAEATRLGCGEEGK